MTPAGRRAAIVVAHPGHELRLHHWVERARPAVCVLTDGSGGTGVPRISFTSELLRRLGAEAGPIFGRFSDAQIYEALLECRIDSFVALAREIERWLEERGVDDVVADAIEGYNPSHDVCHLLVRAAVRALGRRGIVVRDLELGLVGHPADAISKAAAAGEVVRLDDAALERKWRAACDYTALRAEVDVAVGTFGKEAFRVECVAPPRPIPTWQGVSPFYEAYGETRAAERGFTRVIRYRDHVRPLAEALDRLAAST